MGSSCRRRVAGTEIKATNNPCDICDIATNGFTLSFSTSQVFATLCDKVAACHKTENLSQLVTMGCDAVNPSSKPLVAMSQMSQKELRDSNLRCDMFEDLLKEIEATQEQRRSTTGPEEILDLTREDHRQEILPPGAKARRSKSPSRVAGFFCIPRLQV